MFINMVAMHVVQVAVMKIIRVAIVFNSRMSAAGAMDMGMVRVRPVFVHHVTLNVLVE
jgi:hypothetical protein